MDIDHFQLDLEYYDLRFSLTKESLMNGFNFCNGCGAKGGVNVPDHMWFVDIVSACNIHDIEWALAKKHEDLIVANENFDNNLKKICDKESNWFTRPIRRMRIAKYVSSVELYGTKNYSKERNFT